MIVHPLRVSPLGGSLICSQRERLADTTRPVGPNDVPCQWYPANGGFCGIDRVG